MIGDDWFDLPEERRAGEYLLRSQALDLIVRDVREHRAAGCDAAPLCPGAAASDKVNSVPHYQIGELLMTCLAGLADRAEEIDRLRDKVEAAARAHVGQVAHLERKLAAAERDANAGWRAYAKARGDLEQARAERDDLMRDSASEEG